MGKMNWILNLIFILSLVDHLGTDAKGTMLKCGEDIVVGRGDKKNLRFWSSEDELMKVEIFPGLPPKKANDASSLLSIFKNVPPTPVRGKTNDTVQITDSEPVSEIIKKVTFPPAYRISDRETQNVFEISGAELSQNSEQSPSVMTQKNEDLFHPETRDEITESIKNKLNQVKLKPNEATIVEDALTAIRNRITSVKEEVELTTMLNDDNGVYLEIQPAIGEQNDVEVQPETAPIDPAQQAETELTKSSDNEEMAFEIESVIGERKIENAQPETAPVDHQNAEIELTTTSNDEKEVIFGIKPVIEVQKVMEAKPEIANVELLQSTENELTTMSTDDGDEVLGIQSVTEEQKVMETKPEITPVSLYNKDENASIQQNEKVKEDMNHQMNQLKDVTGDLDRPTNNVEAIRNQIITLMGEHEKATHDLENSENFAPAKLSKNEIDANQLKTIESIRAQILKLKQSGENLENLEEIISGVKKQILNLRESIVPVTVKVKTGITNTPSDLITDNISNANLQNKQTEGVFVNQNNHQMKPGIINSQEELTVNELDNNAQVNKHDFNVSEDKDMKDEAELTSIDALHQKETKKTEDSNLAQDGKIKEETAEMEFEDNGDTIMALEVDAETTVKTISPNVDNKEEHIIVPTTIKENADNEYDLNNEMVKPQEYLEQTDNVKTDESFSLSSAVFENSHVDENKEEMKIPEEKQSSAAFQSNIQPHTHVGVEQTTIREGEDSASLDYLSEDLNDFNIKPLIETATKSVSQVFEKEIEGNSNPVKIEDDDSENVDFSNKPKITENVEEIGKIHDDFNKNNNLETSQTNSNQGSILIMDNIQTPTGETDDLLTDTKPLTGENTDTKPAIEEDTAKQSEKTFISVEKLGNEITDIENQQNLLNLELGKINSDNVETELSSKVENINPTIQMDLVSKGSEKDSERKVEETIDETFKTPEHEHMAISIPKDILDSFTNKEDSDITSNNQPTENANASVSNKNTEIHNSDAEKFNKNPTQIINESMDLNGNKPLEKKPIVPEINEELKKVDAEKSKFVEKTIPNIILESLHLDSSHPTIIDETVTQPINMQSDTKFENFENMSSQLSETNSENAKLEQTFIGSVINDPKTNANKENSAINRGETAIESQFTDFDTNPKIISLGSKLENENTPVVTKENVENIYHETKFESLSQYSESTDNQYSISNSDDTGNHDESSLTNPLPIDEFHEDKVQTEATKIQSDNLESDFQQFDDVMQASKTRIDDESNDLHEKPLIEMDYDGVIKYNEELENKRNNVNEVSNGKPELDIKDAQQTPILEIGTHHSDHSLVANINGQLSNQNVKDTDQQPPNADQKIQNKYNADIVTSELEKNPQDLPAADAGNESTDINLEPIFSSQYETDLDKFDQYYDDFHDDNKEITQMNDEVLKVGDFNYPEKFLVSENPDQPLQTAPDSKKTHSETISENISGTNRDEVKNSEEHSQLLTEDKEVNNNSNIEKLKASEIQAGIVRLIEGTLNSVQDSAHNHLTKETENIPSAKENSPAKHDKENTKDITATKEASDIDSIKDTTSEILNLKNVNEESIRKDEIANEKLSKILTKLNEKRVNAENDKILKPVEIYPEDIGYDETQKEYIDANINILKSIVNQVATDLAVNKKEAESKIELNLRPINLVYKPEDEIKINENLGTIDYYSDTDIIPEVSEASNPDEDNVNLSIHSQTRDSSNKFLKEEHNNYTKSTNQKEVQAFIADHEKNAEIQSDEKPTDQILLSKETLQKQGSESTKLEDNLNLRKEMLKKDEKAVEQNEMSANEEPGNSKSDHDLSDMKASKPGEISIPFGFLNWFGKDSAVHMKEQFLKNDENLKITTWGSVISDGDQHDTSTPYNSENNLVKMDENDDQDNTSDIPTSISSDTDEIDTLKIINENPVFSKETGSDNVISLIRDSVVKHQAYDIQEETHSEIPIPFILAKLNDNAAPEEPASTLPVIIKEHDSKVVFFTPNTNSVENKSKNDESNQEDAFNQAADSTTQSTNDSDVTESSLFMNEETLLLELDQINNDKMDSIKEKVLVENVAETEFQKLHNDKISVESKMSQLDNMSKLENSNDSRNIQDEEPEELLFSDQGKESTVDTLKPDILLKDSVNHDENEHEDAIETPAQLITNEKNDDNNFLSILEKYVIDESPVNSYIPEEIYHHQGNKDDQESYNININNHNYQSIPINRFSFNNNDYENVRRRIDENMQDNIQHENRRYDNSPPSDIYQSGSSGPSLSSLLQTRKGFIGPSIDEGHSSHEGAQLRRVDTQHTIGGDPPFFIKLPGSPNAVPVFLQYEPVQVKYVDPELLKKKNPSLKNEQPILPLFKKNVTSNSQRNNIKTTNLENNIGLDSVNAKLEDDRTNEIKSKPDPFFIMEAPDLGKDMVSVDQSILDKPESSPLITDDSLSVNLKGHFNFDQKDSIPSTIIGNKPVYQEYIIKNPDSSYSSSDTQTLSNRVFDLGAKGTIPNSTPEYPQYTPFPLTTNPPRAESIFTESTATSTTTQTSKLIEENKISKTENPQSVDFVTIPSINFNESFDGIAYPDLPLTERLRDDYGFFESDAENTHEKEDNDEKLEDEPVPEIGLFATPKTGMPPKEEEFDIVALANFLHQNQKVWSNNNVAPISEDDGSWRGPVWNNLKYSNVNKEDSWPQPLGDSPWLTNEEGPASARDYTAFYSPEEIPGLDPLYFSYRQMPTASNREPRTQAETEVENIKTFIDKLPIPLKAAVVGESAPIERSKRAAAFGEQIFCEWNFKTEPGLYLLVTFKNLSAPFTVDCYGAYIEVERESNGYGARWCGHRASLTESRQHVIFAKHQVRVSVYDNGDLTKNQVTGFEAEIEAIDLFDSEDYDSFMRSKASSKIRKLMDG